VASTLSRFINNQPFPSDLRQSELATNEGSGVFKV